MDPLALNLLPSPAPGMRAAPPGTSRFQEQPDPAKEAELVDLKATDQRVRAHEAAHQSAGGGLVRGGASFTYRRGSDGQLYAVGGEVTLDTSPVPEDPRATEAKMRRVVAAALAPADPSPQDRAVAARAASAAMNAAAEADRKAPGTGIDLRV